MRGSRATRSRSRGTRRSAGHEPDERPGDSARPRSAVAEVLRLQRTAGNRAVASLAAERREPAPVTDAGPDHAVEERDASTRQTISITIPLTSKSIAGFSAPAASVRNGMATPDAPRGAEEGEQGVRMPQRRRQRLPRVPELGEGESVTIPEPLGEPLQIETADPVLGPLAPNPTIAQGGAGPSGFGVTRASVSMSNITITRLGPVFHTTATVDVPIRWQVRSSTGPSGQVDIVSDSDPDISATNYTSVSTDLTPNMGDLNGRPPRSGFWAKDLTVRHEEFHAAEYQKFGTSGVFQSMAWLNGQTASSTAGVQALLNQVPGRVIAAINAGMAFPGRENRAYGDGAPSYRARADAIRTKGDAGGFGGGGGGGGGGAGGGGGTTPTPTGTTGRIVARPSLRIREGPSTATRQIGSYPFGATITIESQTTGESIHGNDTWDRTNRGFVSDRYVDR